MHELKITRHIAASPDKVWDAMAYRIGEWFCPAPWKAEVIVHDTRPGGRSAMMFRGPDGEEMPQEGVFLEWIEGKRFTSTDAMRIDPDTGRPVPAEPFMIGCWEVEPDGAGTKFTGTALHWSEDAMKKHQEMGFEQGWGAAAGQLAALCKG